MKCIIVEGPQGSGKTTLVNYLREKTSTVNLYRLTGSNDKGISGKEKSKKMYYALLDYMKQIEDSEVNLLFDRMFFSDYVYSRLGYKEYDFSDIYEELLKRLEHLHYSSFYISLYLKDTSLYEERLKRDHHHFYQAFSLENSINQQKMYHSLIPRIQKLANTTVYEIAMDDFALAYEQINTIFAIENGKK